MSLMSSPKVAAVLKRQMHDAADAMAVLLEDLHVGKGFVALLDQPKMLVQPDNDVDLWRELTGKLVKIVQSSFRVEPPTMMAWTTTFLPESRICSCTSFSMR